LLLEYKISPDWRFEQRLGLPVRILIVSTMDILRKVLARFIVIRLISDWAVIMYLGRVVEPGDKRDPRETTAPIHPGTALSRPIYSWQEDH